MGARSRLTFVVQSESLTGDEISRRLGLRPTAVLERAEPTSERVPGAGRRGHTTWQLASPLDEEAEPAAHLAGLFALVEPALPALRQIEGEGGKPFWSCFVTARPMGNMVWLDPPILSGLARLGVPLVFDIYAGDGE
jgi:hypothetical protein